MLNVLLTNIKESKTETGQPVWSFESRGTDYSAFYTPSTGEWEVWSSRKALFSGVGMIRKFGSIQEMKASNKTLASFASYVASKV